MTKPEVLEVVLARVRANGLRTTAKTIGMDASHLCRILNGKKELTAHAAAKLGFRKLPDAYEPTEGILDHA